MPSRRIKALPAEADDPGELPGTSVPGTGQGSHVQSRQASRLPAHLEFPLVVVLSRAIALLGYSFLNGLEPVSRTLSLNQLLVLQGWRLVELAIGWYGSYDSLDLAGLKVLAHGPSLFLANRFYGVSAATALSALAVELLAAAVPVQLVRPLSPAHSGGRVPNRDIITDIPILAYASLLPAAISGVTLFAAFRAFLPRYLVLYFHNIPRVDPAYEASYSSLLPAAFVFGLALQTFVFVPAEATAKTREDDELARFDPAAATLGETFYYNIWGYATKSKVAIGRTLLLAATSGTGTYLQCALGMNGIENAGAVAYALVWVVPILLSGLALGLVGRG